jgi:O-antigen/teichoic acid export membrane protein
VELAPGTVAVEARSDGPGGSHLTAAAVGPAAPEPRAPEPPAPAAKDLGSSEGGSAKRALSDGLSLSISGAVGSLAGFVSWLIAARIMPQEAVGYASAFVSAFLLVAGVAQLNLDSAMMLWMPKAGRKASTLFWRSHLVIIPSCALVGLVYVLLEPLMATTGAGGHLPIWVGGLLFLLAGIGWGLWGVHDFSLIAVGKTWWASWRNIAFAVARIGMLVALGASLGPLGVVLSWVVPIALWTLGSAVVGGIYTRKFARLSDQEWLPTRREAVRFLGPTTLAHWGTVLLFNQVTVIVTQRFGPTTGAAFFIAWQAVMVIDIAAQRFMQSLSAQLARDPENAKAHIRASRKRLYVIFLPMILVGVLLARFGLEFFGPGYAEAADVLRVLLLGMVARLVISHELGVRQARHDGVGFARLQLLSTAFVIAVVLFIPIGPSDAAGSHPVEQLMPVAAGYAISQLVCAVAVVVWPRIRGRRTPAQA